MIIMSPSNWSIASFSTSQKQATAFCPPLPHLLLQRHPRSQPTNDDLHGHVQEEQKQLPPLPRTSRTLTCFWIMARDRRPLEKNASLRTIQPSRTTSPSLKGAGVI